MTGAVHTFSHVICGDPSFVLDNLLDEVPAELADDLASRVKKDAEAFMQTFAPQKVDKDGRPIESAEETVVEKPDCGDGSGPAGPVVV